MKEIVLQGQDNGLRAALLEQGELIEVFEQESGQNALVGNIYRGRVENVLPGMQAAFIDIGLDKNAFLYVADALPQRFVEDEERLAPVQLARVEHVLKPRQELLVQVVKEPVGTKGARVSTNITLPGRYVVLLPKVDYVGVSRKIPESPERERLREIAASVRPPGMGVIVRTLAEGVGQNELADDVKRLVRTWQNIQHCLPGVSVPGLVNREVDLVARLVRDLVDQDVEKVTVDREGAALMLQDALREIRHPVANRVFLDLSGNLFARFGIDDEIRKSLQPKVWLKSGGYLVIQQTEALTVIDVNTGKYVGQHSLQDTVFHTNVEAAREIARQLRLRNLGGIIIIDFIDMLDEDDQKKVLEELETACHRDKIKCDILGLTKLGLVEMTRKKVGQTLATRYTKRCPNCDGRGNFPII